MNIALIIILVLIALLSVITSSFAWLPKQRKDSDEQKCGTEPISIIIMVRDDIDIVERNLPLFLHQHHEPGYEIILVVNEGDSNAEDFIKRHKDEPLLRFTFIPNTSRYVSRDKLGVTLGVKAAHHNWCLLLDGDCYPTTDKWLSTMAEECTENNNIVIGISNYDNDSHRYQRFFRLRHFCQLWRESRYMTVFAANYSNLCFKKDEFISQDGYRGNLEIIRGEYDYIVNKFARKGSTAFVTDENAMITETAPTPKQWRNRRKYYLYSCLTMQRKRLHRLMPNIDTLSLHAAWLLSIASIIYGSIMQDWYILAAGIIALLIELIGRTVIAQQAVKAFHANIPAWNIFALELISIFYTFSDKIRMYSSSKLDFTCHKL